MGEDGRKPMKASDFLYRCFGTALVLLVAFAIVFGALPGPMTSGQEKLIIVLAGAAFLSLVSAIIASIWNS